MPILHICIIVTVTWLKNYEILILSGANLLANFSIAITYETFITLGLVIAVPMCVGKYLGTKYIYR